MTTSYIKEQLCAVYGKKFDFIGKKLRKMNIVVKDNGRFLDEQRFYMLNEKFE